MKKPIGRVYILSNKAMPNLVKIGYTMNTVESRVEELSSTTGVPIEFQIEYQVECRDPQTIEKNIHKELSEYRFNRDREFFEISVFKATTTLRSLIDEIIDEELKFELPIDTSSKQYINERNRLYQESFVIKDWVAVPTKDWRTFLSYKSISISQNFITIWEMLSYRNRMKYYEHMSSKVKKRYFIDSKKYQILYKANYSEENGRGNIISYDDISAKLYDISVHRTFVDVFNIVLLQASKLKS